MAGGGSAIVTVYLQNASPPGSFTLHQTITLSSGLFINGIAADLDNDGFPDLVFITSPGGNETAAVEYLSSSGTFPSSPATVDGSANEVLASDLDNDGLADLVTIDGGHFPPAGSFSGPLEVRFNSISQPGTFGSAAQIVPGNLGGAVFGNYSTGSDRDVVTLGSTNSLYDQTGSGTFSFAANDPVSMATMANGMLQAVDLNGDHRDDFLALNESTVGYALQCTTLGTFSSTTSFPVNAVQAVVDMNGDGKLDLVGFDQSVMPPGNSNVSLLQVSLQ